MNSEFINAMGLPCPMPVVRAKKALEQDGTGCVIVKVDNFTATQNLEKMAAGLGYSFSCERLSDVEFDAVLTKHGVDAATHMPDMAFNLDRASIGDSFVVAISSDIMGRGSDLLGKSLMKAFIYSLTELDVLPQVILFFNSGAFLTSAVGGAISDLQALSSGGTRILTCGACLDFFNLSAPVVGEVTNMYDIASIMSKAQKLINL